MGSDGDTFFPFLFRKATGSFFRHFSLSDGSPVRTGRKPKTPDSSEAKPRLSMPFGTPITTRTATLREEKSRLDRARKSNELTSGVS